MCKALQMAYPIVYGFICFYTAIFKRKCCESTDNVNFLSQTPQYNQFLSQSCLHSDKAESSESLLNRSIYIN